MHKLVGCSCLTLDTLREVPEIEDIVGLSRSGQQIHTQTVVNLHSCIHNLTSAVLHCLGKLTEETVQDGLEEGWEGKDIGTNMTERIKYDFF